MGRDATTFSAGIASRSGQRERTPAHCARSALLKLTAYTSLLNPRSAKREVRRGAAVCPRRVRQSQVRGQRQDPCQRRVRSEISAGGQEIPFLKSGFLNKTLINWGRGQRRGPGQRRVCTVFSRKIWAKKCGTGSETESLPPPPRR